METTLKSELTLFAYKIGILTGITLIGYICYRIQEIIFSLLLAFAFVFLSAPILDIIEKRKISPIFSVTGLLLVTCMFFFLVVTLTVPIIFREVQIAEEFIRNILNTLQSHPEQIENSLSSFAIRYLEPIGIQMHIQDVVGMMQDQAKIFLQQALGFMKSSASVIILGIGNFVQGATFLGMTLVFYIFVAIDRKHIAKTAISFIPKRYQSKLLKSHKEMNSVLLIWWRGQWIDALCMAIMTGGVLWVLQLFGLPISNILSLSIIVGLSVFIPVFGPLIAMIPAVIMALHGGFFAVLVVVLVYTIIQQIEGYVLIPKIHGKALDVNSFELIVYMLVAGSLFGVVGIFITLPFVATFRILLKTGK